MESKNNWKAWLYLAPALILMAVFTFYPLINTFFISFLKNYDYRSGANDGFTFDNYGIVLGLVEKIPGIAESKVTSFVQYAKHPYYYFCYCSGFSYFGFSYCYWIK